MEASDACWSIGASYTRQDFYDTNDFIGKLIRNTFVNSIATIQVVCDIKGFFFLQVGKRVIRTQVLSIKESENSNKLQGSWPMISRDAIE